MKHYLLFVQQAWPLLAFGFLSVFWGNFGQSFFISWYGTPIQESLGISASRYGAIYSAATLASGLLIMLSGGLIDRWPLRRFMRVAALGLFAACVLMASVRHEAVLLVALFMLRFCGQGLLPHMAQTTMGRYFQVNRGKALSISASGVPGGEIVLPVLAVMLIGWLGWQCSWWVIAAAVLVLYLPASHALLGRSRFEEEQLPGRRDGAVPDAGRREMLRDYRFWLALPAILMGPFIITGVFIQQGYVLSEKGWSAEWLATCFILYGIVHWLSSMLVGVLIDRFSARRLLRWMLLPLVLAMLSLASLEGQWVAVLFMLFLGMTIGTVNTVSGALWAEVYGTGRLGSIRSLIAALMILSTAAAPVLLGVLIDQGVQAFTVFGSAALLVVLTMLMSWGAYRL